MPITWKNIEAPNLNGALIALDSAGRSFNSAGNNLNTLFDRIQNVNNNQLDIQNTSNTQDLISRLKGITSLQDFNTQEQSFDPSLIRKQIGTNFDANALQTALLARRGELQNEALAGATTEALKLASQTGSIPDAANTLRQRLIELGVKNEPALANAMNDLMQKSGAPMQKGFDNAEKAATAQAMVQQLTGALPSENQPQGVQAPYAPGSGVSYGQMMAESGGRDYDSNGNILTSPKGAMGRKQVLPSTALDPGLPGVRPMDPEIWKSGDKPKIVAELDRVGDEYMNALRKRYNGNEQLALAAYNAGFGAVDRAGGIPNITETKNYVNRITDPANAKLVMDAAKSRSDLTTEGLNRKQTTQQMLDAAEQKSNNDYIDKTANTIVNHRASTGDLNGMPEGIDINHPKFREAKKKADGFTSIEAVTNDPETQGYLANTSAEVQNNLERLQQELSTKEAQLAKKVEAQSYLMPSDDFMKSVKDKGIAEVFRNKADQTGVVRDWLLPYDYADDVTEGITKIQNNLLKVYKDPEKVAQILAVSLKMAGAEGSGTDGKRKNLDIDAIEEKLNDAKVFVESYVPLKNQYVGLQKNNQDIIRDAQLAAKMALNTDRTEAARKKISNKSYTQADAINEFKDKMQEQLSKINSIQETPTYLTPETKAYINGIDTNDITKLLYGNF